MTPILLPIPQPLNELEALFLDHCFYTLSSIKAKLELFLEEDQTIECSPDKAVLIRVIHEFEYCKHKLFIHMLEKDWNCCLATAETLLCLIQRDRIDEAFEEGRGRLAGPSEVVLILIGLFTCLRDGRSVFDEKILSSVACGYDAAEIHRWCIILQRIGKEWVTDPTIRSSSSVPTLMVSRSQNDTQLLGSVMTDLHNAQSIIAHKDKEIAMLQRENASLVVENDTLRILRTGVHNFCHSYEGKAVNMLQEEIDAVTPWKTKTLYKAPAINVGIQQMIGVEHYVNSDEEVVGSRTRKVLDKKGKKTVFA